MHESKIAEFLGQVEECTKKAEVATDETTKLFYIKLAEGWLAMALNLQRSSGLKKLDLY